MLRTVWGASAGVVRDAELDGFDFGLCVGSRVGCCVLCRPHMIRILLMFMTVGLCPSIMRTTYSNIIWIMLYNNMIILYHNCMTYACSNLVVDKTTVNNMIINLCM